MAAPRPQLLERLRNGLMELLPIAREYFRDDLVAQIEVERADRARAVYQYQLARAVERNRMVALWNHPQAPPELLPIPLPDEALFPENVWFPRTMVDLVSIRSMDDMLPLIRMYGLTEDARLCVLKVRFLAFITNGP